MSHCFKLAYKTYYITRIFGENFVKRNKNKFKIIYNNKEYALKEFFEEIDVKFKLGTGIKFKLRIFNNILNLSGMFFNCNDLLAMKDDSKVNKEQVKAKLKYGLSISKKEEKPKEKDKKVENKKDKEEENKKENKKEKDDKNLGRVNENDCSIQNLNIDDLVNYINYSDNKDNKKKRKKKKKGKKQEKIKIEQMKKLDNQKKKKKK